MNTKQKQGRCEMRIFKTQAEVDSALDDNGDLVIGDSVRFDFSVRLDGDILVVGNIEAFDIKAGNIEAGNIEALDIEAFDVKARNIKACNINAWNIKAGNIDACNITALDIKAGDIKARDITARVIDAGDIKACDIYAWAITADNIEAGDVSYFAFCCAYESIVCKSWKARREKHLPPQCLDGKLTVNGA
jgi:hypothetical protein